MMDRLQAFVTSRLFVAISVIAFALLLAALATLVDWRSVESMLRRADRPMLAFSVLLLTLGYLAYTARWLYLLGGRVGFATVFHIANAGTMVNTLLPGNPGGAVRVALLAGKTGLSIFAVTSSVVVERWYEQIMRLAALGGALIFNAGADETSFLPMLGSLAYLVGSFVLMIFMLRRREWVLAVAPPLIAHLPRITEEQARRWLAELISGLAGVASLRSLLATLLWSILTWTLFWGYHFTCLLALHPTLPRNQMLTISLGSLALTPPSATTLPGIYQISMVTPLALLGYNRDLLTSYSLVMNTIEMAVVLLLGAWGAVATGLTLRQLLVKAKSAAAQIDAK